MIILQAYNLSGSNYLFVRATNGKCIQSIIQIKHSFNKHVYISVLSSWIINSGFIEVIKDYIKCSSNDSKNDDILKHVDINFVAR